MKNLLYILFFFTTSVISSQEIQLAHFKSSNCDEEKEIEKTIVLRNYEEDTFKIKIAAIRNCCSSVSPSVNFKKRFLRKNILYLEHTEYSSNPCMCVCYYEYTIIGLEDDNFLVDINNEKVEQ
jgi:hypothetical protein